jgi:uncharacterized protein with HEPN domain
MSRNYRVYLEDIFQAIEKIEKFTTGFSLKKFSEDPKTVDAVIRNLEVIGEAAKNVPNYIRNQQSGVDWKKICGLRDVLIHDYFGVDVEIVWDVAKHHVPVFKKQIQKLLEIFE